MAVKMLENNDFDCIYSVGRFETPIWRSFAMTDSGLVFNFPKHAKSRSQDLPAAFYDAGQFYCFNIPSFLKLDNKNYFGERKGAVVIDSMNIQDIDDMEDWKLAEIKAKYIEATSG
jgi:N-acylneuraminate cytidylyltransferase